MQDRFLVRRTTFSLGAKINEHWSLVGGYKFVRNGKFSDMYVKYHGWAAGDLRLGQFKAPFGLVELTSSKYGMFIERPMAVDAFKLSKRVGLAFQRNGERYTFTAMQFGSSIDGHEGSGTALRYTRALVRTEQRLLHLGVAFVVRRPRQHTLGFKATPESHPTDIHFVNTGTMMDASRVHQAGLELAVRDGAFTAQGEWMRARVQRQTHADADLGGWYVEGSWMFRGARRRYKDGKFTAPTFDGKALGAWELGMRYSRIDLDDGPLTGGEETNISVGATWYIRSNARLMLNYIHVESMQKGIRDNPDILLARAQLYF